MAKAPRFPGAPTASWEMIQLRAQLLGKIRQFFDSRGFTEVETPLLSGDSVVDRHLDPIQVEVDGEQLWLQTSPEFGMKRLLAEHPHSIYQITRAFRRGERGDSHNPEFTMVEWYGVGDDQQAAINLLGELSCDLLETQSFGRSSYRQAFEDRWSFNPHAVELERLREIARQAKFDRDGCLDWLWVDSIQPHLGRNEPTVVFDYPASQSALARLRRDDCGDVVAERFELFYRGVELANGYHELRDANELRCRARQVNEQRAADGKERLPEDSLLLHAMDSGLPSCAGVAMGLDRVLMALTNAATIDEVIPFPFEIA